MNLILLEIEKKTLDNEISIVLLEKKENVNMKL